MRVLMFGWEYPPHNSGGLGVACQGLARALCAQGIDLTFVLPRTIKTDEAAVHLLFADMPHVKVHSIPTHLMPYLTPEGYRKLDPYSDLFSEVARYAEAAKAIAEAEDFDLIHAHDWLSFGAGMSSHIVSGKPFVGHVHATEVDRTIGNVHPYIYKKELEGVSAAHKVISVSEFTKRTLVERYGIPEDKVSVVHNGIDTGMYDTPVSPAKALSALKNAGKQIVLFVGRITIMKGPDHFVHAAQKVLEYNKNALFVMAGSGDMYEQIINMSIDFGISDSFLFTGFLRDDDLSALYKAADLFVMPSVSEPFGITPLESMAHGTPVLISKQSGVSEVVDHALKVDFWDVDDMAAKILAVLDHKSMRDLMGVNGRKQLRGVTWEEAAKKTIALYEMLLSGKH